MKSCFNQISLKYKYDLNYEISLLGPNYVVFVDRARFLIAQIHRTSVNVYKVGIASAAYIIELTFPSFKEAAARVRTFFSSYK